MRAFHKISILSLALAITGCAFEKDSDVEGDFITEGTVLQKADGPLDRYQGDIQFDDRVSGHLPATVSYHLYTFDSTGDSEAFIDLASREGDDTFLALYLRAGGSWTFIDSNDDCSGSLNSCLTTSLNEGRYLVLATTYDYAARGLSPEASYELEVFCQGGACAAAEVCGTRGTNACSEGSFCDWEDANCGRADVPGVCEIQPTICTNEFAPVCGCDGVTYNNECNAASEGMDVDHQGPCAGDVGATCAGLGGFVCNGALSCDMSDNVGCNIADAAGVCTAPTQVLCTLQFDPVCGCDGQQFSNDCFRKAAGVALDPSESCL